MLYVILVTILIIFIVKYIISEIPQKFEDKEDVAWCRIMAGFCCFMLYLVIFCENMSENIFTITFYSLIAALITCFCTEDICFKEYKIKRFFNFIKLQRQMPKSGYVYADTEGLGFKIIDIQTGAVLAEMLPNGEWINYYLKD